MPFPPPIDVQLIDVQPGRIAFNWTSVDAQCDSLSYNIISFNCGTCPSTTSNTSILCSGVVASGQVCTLIVRAVVCGNTGNQSNPISVIMKGMISTIPDSVSIHCINNYLFCLLVHCSSKSFNHTQCPTL